MRDGLFRNKIDSTRVMGVIEGGVRREGIADGTCGDGTLDGEREGRKGRGEGSLVGLQVEGLWVEGT